jgi:alpha-L-arabinofuranosidase
MPNSSNDARVMIRPILCAGASLLALTVAAITPGSTPPRAAGSITVDVSAPGAPIAPSLYGIFFEEISHAGEGGLYAELIQNRGFEDSRLPPGCSLENGQLIPPRTPHFWNGRVSDWKMPWNLKSPTPGWTLETAGNSEASMRLDETRGVSEASPHSVEIRVKNVAEGGRVALVNSGFWGINVQRGEKYRLRFYYHASLQYRGGIRASLEGADGRVLASSKVMDPRSEPRWIQYETTLTASASDPQAKLALIFERPSTIHLDFVSLFPERTWRNRPNGMRVDLAEMIAGLKPAFVRWPGGCFVEGIAYDTRPQWKRSIGRLEDRPGTYSPWGYWSSDGFGYHEFLQFSEDLGADALYVANAGVSCAFRSGTYLPDDQLDTLVQDTLDAIEYAIGPPTSTWGAVRAKNGHPQPFPLKYVEIGNEQQGPKYGERVKRFYAAIKEKYPPIKVALSSWIAGIDRPAIDAAGRIDIVDEHAYKPVHWAIENFDSFAKYKREGWDLYIGEFATNGGVGRGNLLAALNDAAYMMSMEKNGDLVKMGSYAPLLENVNKRDWEVNLIHFDSSRVYGRAAYHAVRLFAENRPDVNLATTVDYSPGAARPIAGRIGVATHETSAEFKDVIVERDGQVAYRSDFTKGAHGWTPQGRRGTWAAEDGVYRQKDRAVAVSYFSEAGWNNVTISAKARKIAGAEGFMIVAGTADGRRVQWNVGGWGNRRHAVQADQAVVGEFVDGSVEEGRWYDVRLEVRDRTVQCFLDGALVMERTLPRVDRVLAVSGRDERTGEIVLKVVNTAPDPARMTIAIKGASWLGSLGLVTVLTSVKPEDENSFEAPQKIEPKTSSVAIKDFAGAHTFPAYSLTIIRIPARP